MITLYGVNNREFNNTKFNMIYEEDLTIYNKLFQKYKYNEGSSLYHIYVNKLYKKYDYIGLFQYDMTFSSNTIDKVKEKIINNSNINYIFYMGFFPDIKKSGFLGGHQLIINNAN
jgi:CRISPR/Cas system-associated protein Cas5 (RAMP superfamily)